MVEIAHAKKQVCEKKMGGHYLERFTPVVFCGVVVRGGDLWSGAGTHISDKLFWVGVVVRSLCTVDGVGVLQA